MLGRVITAVLGKGTEGRVLDSAAPVLYSEQEAPGVDDAVGDNGSKHVGADGLCWQVV